MPAFLRPMQVRRNSEGPEAAHPERHPERADEVRGRGLGLWAFGTRNGRSLAASWPFSSVGCVLRTMSITCSGPCRRGFHRAQPHFVTPTGAAVRPSPGGGVRLLCGSSRPGANDGFPSCGPACCLAGGSSNGRSLAPGAKAPWNLVRFVRTPIRSLLLLTTREGQIRDQESVLPFVEIGQPRF
jgi:hypothetical protein